MLDEAISCHCSEIKEIEDKLEILERNESRLDAAETMIENMNKKLGKISGSVDDAYVCDNIASVQDAINKLSKEYESAHDDMRDAVMKKQAILKIKLGALKAADVLFHVIEKQEQ